MRPILGAAAIVVAVLLILAAVIGVSVGLGWILTLILPFSLFEATLLSLLAGAVTGVLVNQAFRAPSGYEPEDVDSAVDGIPPTLFYESEEDKTWENFFRYTFAEGIYVDLLTSPRWAGSMSVQHLQELSVQLADAAVAVLKKKSPRAERMRIGYAVLKMELDEPGRPSYDEDLLDLAVLSVNLELSYLADVLETVIKDRLWDQRTDSYW
jgi:hypothetical protein